MAEITLTPGLHPLAVVVVAVGSYGVEVAGRPAVAAGTGTVADGAVVAI